MAELREKVKKQSTESKEISKMQAESVCWAYLKNMIGYFYIEADEIGVRKVMLKDNKEETIKEIEKEEETIKEIEKKEETIKEIEEVEETGNIERIDWDLLSENQKKAQYHLNLACQQLEEYFQGNRKTFDVPVHMKGTPFQQSVWNALREIPYGETRSYKEIAQAIGNPKACRAVGMANNRNQILIIVPCHRVIGADGSLVGFGCGLNAKKYLLNLEK